MEEKSRRVGAIVLAAGSSSRLGQPKQLIRLGGTSLLRRAVIAALQGGCCPVVVVLGANAELSRRELEGLEVHAVVNEEWESGMASSIRAGVERLLQADASVEAAVILLCDQPHVTADAVSALLAAHRATRQTVVASAYGGGGGVPALFARALFGELSALTGGAGAKAVIQRHAAAAHWIDFPGGDIDVDTPEDLERLLASD